MSHPSQPRYIDPFAGQYPRAPHMRPVDLPDARDPSRSHSNLPAVPNGSGLSMHGVEAVHPSQPALHPFLLADPRLGCALVYGIMHPPSLQTIGHRGGMRLTSADLQVSVTSPPSSAIRASVLYYPAGPRAAPQRLPWLMTLAPGRRCGVQVAGKFVPALSLLEALTALYVELQRPVVEGELSSFSHEHLRAAESACRVRCRRYPRLQPGLVRADFLVGCTQLAGFIYDTDGSFSVRLITPAV